MTTIIDKNSFPRLEPDLNLGVIISPITSGTGRGNSAHDSGTGRFTFLPKGVNIVIGQDLAQGLTTQTAKLFREKAAAVGANQAALRVINGNLHVVLLVDGKRMASFQVEPKDKRANKNNPNDPNVPGDIGAPTPELSTEEKDFVIKLARNLGITGEKIAEKLKEQFKGISPPQIQQLEQLINTQRIDDLVHYLDTRLRIEVHHEKIDDAQIRIAVGRGFLRRSFAAMDEDAIRIVIQRLQGLGWSQDELTQGVHGKLPKRFKSLVKAPAQNG